MDLHKLIPDRWLDFNELFDNQPTGAALKCPKDRPDGAFYLKPLPKPNASVWYSKQPVGHNTLTNTVRRLCDEAGIEFFFY